jgi:predicted HicB family RNase H-like nuclease
LSDRFAKIGAMDGSTYRYTHRAEYAPESGEYVGGCLEFPAHYSRAPTAHGAIEGIEQIVEEIVADLESCGAKPPDSVTDRRYSGNFVVRTSPQLHSRLVVEANEQGVSLNHWVIQKLAGRNPTPSIDDLF